MRQKTTATERTTVSFYNIFLDTEFMEDGETIKPLSLGFVTETNKTLYMVITDVDHDEANEFVKENVIPYLHRDEATYCTRKEAGPIIKDWIRNTSNGKRIKFWANYGAYDWVLLCQLFGPMVDLPIGWPMYCNEIQQELRNKGYYRASDLPELTTVKVPHNCLDDAKGVKERYEWLRSI